MAEITLYQTDGVLVSNARVAFGEKTYALRNITSVDTKRIPVNYFVSVLLIVLGVSLLALTTRAFFYPDGSTYLPQWAIVSLLMIAAGVYEAVTKKPSYVILFNSSGGEIQAMVSKDKDKITTIAKAINDAIVHQA